METVNLVENLTLTKLMEWLNEEVEEKVTGKPFQIPDVQGYANRGFLPKNYGGNIIEVNQKIKGVTLYNVKKESHFDLVKSFKDKE